MRYLVVVGMIVACGPKEDFSGHVDSVHSTSDYDSAPSTYALSNSIVLSRGSHTYSADFDAVYRAVKGALVVLNFPIAIEADGVIKTGPKRISSQTTGEGRVAWGRVQESYSTETFDLAWVVHVERDGDRTRVVAVPRAYFNQAELAPQQPSWSDAWLGPNWSALFNEINGNIGAASKH